MSEKLTKLASYLETYAQVANILSTPGQIQQWQSFLKSKGGSPSIAADGIWGPQTAQATENFQMNNNLAQTGTVDAQTFALAQQSAQPQADPSAPSAPDPNDDAQMQAAMQYAIDEYGNTKVRPQTDPRDAGPSRAEIAENNRKELFEGQNAMQAPTSSVPTTASKVDLTLKYAKVLSKLIDSVG